MAITVIEDIIATSGARLTIKGWEFDAVFIVSGLEEITGAEKYVAAVTATGVIFGSSHPTISTALAVEFTPEPIESSNDIRVTILYREFSQDIVVDIGSRTLNNETSGWLNDPDALGGDPRASMVLLYTYPGDYLLKPGLAGEAVEQSVRLAVKQDYPTFVITRTEWLTIAADGLPIRSLTGETLTDRQVAYNNKTNKTGWLLRPDDDAHSWKVNITAASAEDGLAYRVRYAFTFDANLWRFEATFIDPYSGQPVPDPIDDVGQIQYDQYLAANFNLLELS